MNPTLIRQAATLIQEGKLVAFPTETVYGLGANALSDSAVRKIYEAKERPSTSPLIVHVSSPEMARELAWHWPDEAEKLVTRFWPGPLTLIVHKKPLIPDAVTAGLPTVGLRMPSNPIALALIRAAGLPIAAPSANRFTELSPTRAEHVEASLGDRVSLILDGGPCEVGIESTVLSVATDPPTLYRPGMISREQIEAIIGPVQLVTEMSGAQASPGLHRKHYSPHTQVVLVAKRRALPKGDGAWLSLGRKAKASRVIDMPKEAQEYAACLYNTLFELDKQALDWIAVELPPDSAEWQGVLDRLRRAAAK